VQLLREGYHERLFLLTDEREGLIVRKQTKAESSTLLAEISWLEELPPSLHCYFPRVLRSSKENTNGQAPSYDMPYFGPDWVLLSELMLTQALSHTRAITLLSQVMQIMFEAIFPTTSPQEEPHYPGKVLRLLEQSIHHITQLPVFLPILHSDTVTLNGVQLQNVLPLLHQLTSEKRATERLRPAAVRKVHGDLYPENVLVRIPSLSEATPQMMLLDPVAAIGLGRGDFAMDIAKFRSWLSAELLALRLGLFSVQEESASSPCFTLTLHTEDAQLQALRDGALLREFILLLDTAKWARAVCDADPQWRERVSFYEALYALSMVPFVPFPQSLARFLVGARHLHNFVHTAKDHQRTAQLKIQNLRQAPCSS